MRKKALLMFLFCFATLSLPAWAQEVIIRAGDTRETGSTSSSQTYSYGFTYLQGLGENMAWSVGYLNEGHVPDHKRDGVDLQLWARTNIIHRQLSLGVAAGPYVYWDTVLATTVCIRTITAWARSSARRRTGTRRAVSLSRGR